MPKVDTDTSWLALCGGSAYTPDRIIPEATVLIKGERIAAVGPCQEIQIPNEAQRLDTSGLYVCPGLVDIHVHGGDGADCTDGSEAAVRAVARRHLRAGTTSLLATTATAPLTRIWRAFDAIIAAMQTPQNDEARLLGIHMEGPFLSLEQRGSHAPELLRMPTPAERERLLSYTPHLRRVTLAPEREDALSLIQQLSERDVLVSGGHSDALYGQVCRAIRAGMSHVTHLWSGMSSVRRIGPKRYAGMLEAALVEEGLTGEIIADGYHLPTSLMRMAYRLKGPEKLCLISDAMRASGKGPGRYEIAGVEAIVEKNGGVAISPDRTAFAGSISTLTECLRHTVQVVGLSLRDALRMATTTPAAIAGVGEKVGRLAEGYPADVVSLDRASLEPKLILRAGNVVHSSPSNS